MLRARRERPRGHAANHDDEFSPPDMDCHAPLPRGSCNGGTISHLDVLRCEISTLLTAA